MRRGREFVVTNLAALILLAVVLAAGWWDATAFGLAVLLVLDVAVLVRERLSRHETDMPSPDSSPPGPPVSGRGPAGDDGAVSEEEA